MVRSLCFLFCLFPLLSITEYANAAPAQQLFEHKTTIINSKVLKSRNSVRTVVTKKRSLRLRQNGLNQLRAGREISLNLANKTYRFKAKNRKADERLGEIFTGELSGAKGQATLVFKNKQLISASIVDGKTGEANTILDMGNGNYETQMTKVTQLPEHGEISAPEPTAEALSSIVPSSTAVVAAADGTITIDIAVLYTPEARAADGGTAAIQSRIKLAVAQTNTTYANSKIYQRLNLVYVGETKQTEEYANFSTMLSRISTEGDGYFDETAGLRNQYGADLVSLITENYKLCGLGYLLAYKDINGNPLPQPQYGFNVVSRRCTGVEGSYSFAHELGHNMGAHHNKEDTGGDSVIFPYAYGHRFTGTNNQPYRTIMSYRDPFTPNSIQIPYFSNPEILYAGRPTGTASANNALVLNNTAAVVAGYKDLNCTVKTPSLSITAPSQSVLAGGTIFYTVSIKNNDTAGCGSSIFNFTVAVPSGWATVMSATSASVAPGTIQSFSLGVKSSATAQVGVTKFVVAAGDNLSAIHTGTILGNFEVRSSSGTTTTTTSTSTTSTSSTTITTTTSSTTRTTTTSMTTTTRPTTSTTTTTRTTTTTTRTTTSTTRTTTTLLSTTTTTLNNYYGLLVYVRTSTGQPISDVMVYRLHSTNYTVQGVCSTSASGICRFTNLPLGSRNIYIARKSGLTLMPNYINLTSSIPFTYTQIFTAK